MRRSRVIAVALRLCSHFGGCLSITWRSCRGARSSWHAWFVEMVRHIVCIQRDARKRALPKGSGTGLPDEKRLRVAALGLPGRTGRAPMGSPGEESGRRAMRVEAGGSRARLLLAIATDRPRGTVNLVHPGHCLVGIEKVGQKQLPFAGDFLNQSSRRDLFRTNQERYSRSSRNVGRHRPGMVV